MSQSFLNEDFTYEPLNNKLKWHSEPNTWKISQGQLRISPSEKTDFWQRTHYGFQADNGHLLFAEIEDDFVIETQVHCDFKHQYDQAGLMVRISDQCWIKTSVEYEPDEPNKLGVVVTNHGYSDWSTQDVADGFITYKLQISRTGSDYKVAYFNETAEAWIQLRLFHLFDDPKVKAGIYCCCPKGNGFTAHFEYLKIWGKDKSQ